MRVSLKKCYVQSGIVLSIIVLSHLRIYAECHYAECRGAD